MGVAARRTENVTGMRLLEDGHISLVARLRARQQETEEAIFARVRAMGESEGSEDAEYQAGLRATVGAVLDYGLTCIEQEEDLPTPVPSMAIAQARHAARIGVSLDTIVLRYIAGHRLLGESIMEETERSGLGGNVSLQRHLRRRQEAVLENITATVAREYKQERQRVMRSAEQHRRDLVQKLLEGEPTDVSELDYDFDAWHLAVIACGADVERALKGLADGLGRHLLPVWRGERTVWAWLGGRRKLTVEDIERQLACGEALGMSLAVGEPRKGMDGWRLTHHEAQAARLVALRKPQRLTRCSDVLLEAAVLEHATLTRSLVDNYLLPLEDLRIGAEVARQTLRAYFSCKLNTSSTAHLLGVTRHTVENRLREIEKILGRPLATCLAELEVALRLEALKHIEGEAPIVVDSEALIAAGSRTRYGRTRS